MSWKDSVSKSILRPLPWWIVVLASFFVLIKLQLSYIGSPCAVLGMHGVMDNASIKKKFRQISMCTHPDRLRGRLNRNPTVEETRRGEVLFNRASASKDELQDVVTKATKKLTKKKKHADPEESDQAPILYCNGRSASEVALRQTIRETWREMREYFELVGISTTIDTLKDFVWGIFSFQQGFMGSLVSVVWISFFYKMIKSLIVWLWSLGITAPFHMIQVIFVAPLPTLIRFFYLPFLRIVVYCEDFLSLRPKVDIDSLSTHEALSEDEVTPINEDADNVAKVKKKKATSVSASTAQVAVAAADESGLRRRKRIKPGEEEKRQITREEKIERQMRRAMLSPNAPDAAESDDDEHIDTPNMSARELVSRTLKGKEQLCRIVGAKNIQVELLVILTKPILPLVMVVAFGQVWSGFLMSIVMWEAYRRVPAMFYEYHHFLCMMFGFIHTWIGVTANEVERQAESEAALYRLQWEWNYRDLIMVLFMCLVGAENTVHSALGNEPAYTSSFASGIALRILLESVRTFSAVEWMEDSVSQLLMRFGIQVATSPDQLVYSGGGVGDCGGGPFEMLVGEQWAWFFAMLTQVALCALPLLYSCMWLRRAMKGTKNVRGSNNMYTRRLPRLFSRFALGGAGLLQVVLFLTMSINTSHGGLYNFWLCMLVGIWMESLITAYDIRGPVRSLVFLFVFCFI